MADHDLRDYEDTTDEPIPPAEEDNLVLTLADAMELAEDGDVAGGRDLLEGGLCRAADLEDGGEPWGTALIARYRLALHRYAGEFGARSG